MHGTESTPVNSVQRPIAPDFAAATRACQRRVRVNDSASGRLQPKEMMLRHVLLIPAIEPLKWPHSTASIRLIGKSLYRTESVQEFQGSANRL
jgi:hypothetical protein